MRPWIPVELSRLAGATACYPQSGLDRPGAYDDERCLAMSEFSLVYSRCREGPDLSMGGFLIMRHKVSEISCGFALACRRCQASVRSVGVSVR
jgi:hypothetical protein